MKHAYERLNAIPHRYADTDFALIRQAMAPTLIEQAWRADAGT